LAKEEYLVHPGKKSTLKYPKVDGAKYIGVVALFRNIEQHHWQIVKPVGQSLLTQHFSSTLKMRMKDNTIRSTL
jgi:type VI secretion system VasD/TssJ family lipoprotein